MYNLINWCKARDLMVKYVRVTKNTLQQASSKYYYDVSVCFGR